MTTSNTSKGSRNDLAGGAILILVGVFYMLIEYFDFDLSQYTWPFYVIVPGLLIIVFALTLEVKTGKWVVTAGSIITMAGLILLYQNTFNHFESWAYGWALLVPTAVGLGQVFFGNLKSLSDLAATGKRNAKLGIYIFVIGAVFFEVVIGISEFRLSNFGLDISIWPVLLIGLGLYVLLRDRVRELWKKSTKPTTNEGVE